MTSVADLTVFGENILASEIVDLYNIKRVQF